MKKPNKKLSAKKSIDAISWERVEDKASRAMGNDINIYVTQKKNPRGFPRCYITFKKVILDQMGWVVGDRLGIFNNKDNQLHWMVAKVSVGNKLGAVGRYFRVSFVCSVKNIPQVNNHELKYEIHKDRVSFFISGKEN